MSLARDPRPPRRSDGQQTYEAILEAAMRLASVEGLGSVTIGRLADEVDVSKSGVFAHFRSKERLQQETIEAARQVFGREVLEPAHAAPEGLPRLEALCDAFLSYVERGVFPGGCFFAQLLGEYDARDGAIHDEVVADHGGWLEMLEQLAEAARSRGELDQATDPRQLAFDLYAALELANYLFVLHRDPSMVERGRYAVRSAIGRARPGLRRRRR